MNKRGQQLVLENLGKLIYLGLILVLIVAMTISLLAIFTNKDSDWTAKRNLQLVVERIATAQKNNEQQVSVVLQVPEGYGIYSFSRGQSSRDIPVPQSLIIHSEKPENALDARILVLMSQSKMKRPSSLCPIAKSCLCVFKEAFTTSNEQDLPGQYMDFDAITCKEYDIDTMDVVWAYYKVPHKLTLFISANRITSTLEENPPLYAGE